MRVLLASLMLSVMPTIAEAQLTPPWWPFPSPAPVDERKDVDPTSTASIAAGAPARPAEFEYSPENGFGDRSPKAILRPRG